MLRNYPTLLIGCLAVLAIPLYAADPEPVKPVSVQLDVLFVDFPTKEIEHIARNSTRTLPDAQDILALWREGKGALLQQLIDGQHVRALSESLNTRRQALLSGEYRMRREK